MLPNGRLQTADKDALLEIVALREPGDVKMTPDPRPRFANGSVRVERLSVATPVYNDLTGEFFGMALIEADVSGRIEDVLLGLGGVECDVFVANGEGRLWASATLKDGVQLASKDQVIEDLPPEVQSLMDEQGIPFETEKELEYVGKRFLVDPGEKGILIFARLPVED